MRKPEIDWKSDGWTAMQDADAEKHLLEITCRAEAGVVVEIRIRHNDGENAKGKATLNGENILPMPIREFAELYTKGALEIR